MQTKLNHETCHKFRDAEHLWFWFVSARKIRNGFHRPHDNGCRCCELIDVETLVTKLFLSGKLSREQLIVMTEWGVKRRVPNQYIYAENKDAFLWAAAFKTLTTAFGQKDWIN